MEQTGLDLRVETVSKQFGETRALSEVSLSVRPGSVHALIGENGAGKSTLGRIISGVIRPDAGRTVIDGAGVQLHSPRDALDRGIATIAQELALVPALTAAENVLLGNEPRRFGFVERGQMRRLYSTIAASIGFDVPPDQPVRSLSVARQQEVEIMRALSRDARLIVMDEPTARLSAAESTKLHAIIRALAESGRSVLLISHFLAEVLQVADEVTVLRDGLIVRHSATADETEASLIEAMLGREPGDRFPPRRPLPADAPIVLLAERLGGPDFSEATLNVRAGEIVGLAGLVGAGRTELGRVVAGVERATTGRLELNGQPRRFRSPREARRHGVVMLPESRRDEGLFYLLSARRNASISTLAQSARYGFVDGPRERGLTDAALARAQVTAGGDVSTATLSGGNQQKLLFARMLLDRPALLIADEPTRGVDVGAKRAIYDLLGELAADGLAILLISSEMDEILGLAHRVVVMRGGRTVGELAGNQRSEQRILRLAFEGGEANAA